MTQANDSILVTPGSGATVATHTVGSKEHQAVVVADEDGHIQGSTDLWTLWQQPRVTTAAATDFFDLFNATGSGKLIRLRGLYPIKQVTAASAVVPHFEFAVIRTSAAGTGGTAVSFSTPATAPPATGALSATPADTTNTAIPAQITARSLPTGGATAAAFWFSVFQTNEETHVASELGAYYNALPETPYGNPWVLREGEGFKVRQITATASTGTNYGWLLSFVVI